MDKSHLRRLYMNWEKAIRVIKIIRWKYGLRFLNAYYAKEQKKDQDLKKQIMMTVGASIFLIAAANALPHFFRSHIQPSQEDFHRVRKTPTTVRIMKGPRFGRQRIRTRYKPIFSRFTM